MKQFVINFLIFLAVGNFFTFITSCTQGNVKKQWKELQVEHEAKAEKTLFDFPCLPDSVVAIQKTEQVPDGKLSLPIGDSAAFFHQFPKKWEQFSGWSTPEEKGDSLSDAMLNCLNNCQIPSPGLLFKTECYSAYIITNQKEDSYWQQVGLVTVSPENKLIDTLNLKSLYTFKTKDMTYQRFFYIGKDATIHTKVFGKSNYNETRYYGGHDEFKILSNGVISPYHEVDFETEFVEKGLLGNRVLKGKTILGYPHGKWAIMELDMGLPYPKGYEKYVDYTYSVAEGEFYHGAKIGTWNYYKMKLDTVVDREAQTYTFPTYEKSEKIIKTENYVQGMLTNTVFFHDSADFQPISSNNIGNPRRYSSNLYRTIKSRKYYVNYPNGIPLKENINSNYSIKNLNYGEAVEIIDDAYNTAKDYLYFENVLANVYKVKSGETIGFASNKYLTPFPLPSKESYQKLSLSEYASKYSTAVKELEKNLFYEFYNCDVAEAFFFLRNLAFEDELYVWINSTPIAEGFKNSTIRKIEINSEPIEGIKAPISNDGKFYKINTLKFTFKPGAPYKQAVFTKEGENVKLKFE